MIEISHSQIGGVSDNNAYSRTNLNLKNNTEVIDKQLYMVNSSEEEDNG